MSEPFGLAMDIFTGDGAALETAGSSSPLTLGPLGSCGSLAPRYLQVGDRLGIRYLHNASHVYLTLLKSWEIVSYTCKIYLFKKRRHRFQYGAQSTRYMKMGNHENQNNHENQREDALS